MRFRFWISAAIVVLTGATQCAFAGLTEEEQRLLQTSLSLANLTPQDMLWDRHPFSDPWRMPIIDEGLDQPIRAADDLLSLHQALGNQSVTQILRTLEDTAFGNKWPTASINDPLVKDTSLPPDLQTPVSALARAIANASAEIRQATSKLSATESRALIESLPQLSTEESTIHFDFVDKPSLSLSEALALLKKVDLPRIRAAAASLSQEIDAQLPALSRAGDISKPITTRTSGLVVRIFGKGNDVHTATDGVLTIDLGGDDTYLGRVGAGVGYASVLIDLNGNDRYDTRDLSVGAGVLGVGIARDLAGDDVYSAGAITAGAGLAGVGVLVDSQGNDTYRSTCLSQGFACFGVGALIDGAGDDTYQVQLLGQGASRTQGAGLLIDRSGDDTYRAGGLILNSPLFQDVTYSFSQGFSMGYREDTGGTSGGLGMLTDLAGRDAYIAETYAQAASYWLSVGTLMDASGHDTYSAYHYAQASAMHLTSAYLFDLAGDDIYGMKFGASHAIGHDYGVAFLLDRAGNDNYFAQDSVPGIGNANGIGIFLDVTGTDRYQGPPGRGNAARGSGSLGLFVDGSGQDVYREGLADAEAAMAPTWGYRYDVASPKTSGPSGGAPPRPVPGSIKAPDSSQMEALYKKATQWAVGAAQPEVEEALATLVGIGMPAVQWMLDNRLEQADRLAARAFVEVIRDVGPDARIALRDRVLKGNENAQRVGLGIAVDGGFKEVSPAVVPAISNPKLELQAVRAAGALASTESVPALIPLCLRKDQTGLSAIISLAQIGDERGYSTAEALVTNGNLLVREACLQLMSKFPLRGLDTGKRLTLEPDERTIRIGLELLGMLGSPEALTEVGSRLLDPAPGVRAQALMALNNQCPPDLRLTFLSLKNDPDPMVRAVAARVDPGR